MIKEAAWAFVVPWRDRGLDPLRRENLEYVLTYLDRLSLAPVHVVNDGRSGLEPFCRHAAYNHGAYLAREDGCDTVVYYESDIIVDPDQLLAGVNLSLEAPGLVVPFTTYRYMSPETSEFIRVGGDVSLCEPESTMENGTSIGACNILSMESLDMVGQWATEFAGNSYDDRAMERAFEICCGPTRYIEGGLDHLYHQPAWYKAARAEVSAEDKAVTLRNKARYQLYKNATTPEQIRALTSGTV